MSKQRQAQRKGVRCQAITPTEMANREQCRNIATGFIRLPAKVYVCAEHRKLWRIGTPALTFTTDAEPASV